MNTEKGHPTRDELLAMAYVDGELADQARAELEARLAAEPELGRQIAAYRKLDLLGRAQAPPEPMDHEWRRLARDGVQRAGLGLGWSLVFVAGLGLLGWAVWAVATDPELELTPKLLIGGALLGASLLFLATLRARLRTLPYDPYTEVER